MTDPSMPPTGDQRLRPEPSPFRHERQWLALDARLDGFRARKMRPRSLGLAAILGALSAVAAGAWLADPGSERERADALEAGVMRLESGDGAHRVHLENGTWIELAPHTLMTGREDDSEVAFDLRSGAAMFGGNRARLSVRIGQLEVQGEESSFHLEREGETLAVTVASGHVAVVRSGSTVVVLSAGEHWRGPITRSEIEIVEAEVEHVEATAEPSPELANEESEHLEAPERTHRRSSSISPSATSPEELERELEQGRELFESAQRERHAGHSERAATLLLELVEHHAEDPRAPLAAFELGRLQMDVLHDSNAAIRSLELALSAAPHAAFGEDALARLVRIHHRALRIDACEAARSRYEAVFPNGVHRAELQQLCTNE